MTEPPLNRLSSQSYDLPRACHVGILAIEVYAPDTYVRALAFTLCYGLPKINKSPLLLFLCDVCGCGG
jgi:hypothetical protein